MRLLNTTTYLLEEFFEGSIPMYAILSHRWEAEEVIFQDFDPVKGFTSARQKKGWSKLVGCCTQGIEDGYEWVWIDTCCIDKSSSAELSEAINSMFRWYKVADICYAYLSDVGGMDSENPARGELKFVDSEWFKRGWTLQELLAPEVLVFFNRSWRRLGDKEELEGFVKRATAIQNLKHYNIASIAQKMSWASKRRTTRIEDGAYSLMGIFGIHMSPIYGEGERAFLRLQLEIIKISDDESVFAWRQDGIHRGMLADSPDAFGQSGGVMRCSSGSSIRSFEMTNRGLRFKSPLFAVPWLAEPEEGVSLLLLNCTEVQPSGEVMTLLIALGKIGHNEFVRSQLVRYHTSQLDPFKNRDGDRSGINEFHVIQSSDESPTTRGPYTFTTRTAEEVTDKFKFSGLDYAYVSDLIRAQWSVSEDGEMVLKTSQLPATGINATLIMREKDHQEDTSESEPLMKLFIVIQIYKSRLEYQSMYLPAESNIDATVVDVRLWQQKLAREQQQVGLGLDRKLGPSVRIERTLIDYPYDSYRIGIRLGLVAPVEYGSLLLRQTSSNG